ncbi:MAG: hypothetical protein U1E17_04465 [Geminicoccaceae bacterium]
MSMPSTAIAQAKADTARPTLICCKTVIGKGALRPRPAATTAMAPARAAEISEATRAAIGWPHAPFVVPEPVRAAWSAVAAGETAAAAWSERFAAYRSAPRAGSRARAPAWRELPADFAARAEAVIAATVAKGESIAATRKASQNAIQASRPSCPS